MTPTADSVRVRASGVGEFGQVNSCLLGGHDSCLGAQMLTRLRI